MRRLAALALLLLALAPAAAQTPPQPFRVVNRTPVEATALYAVRSGRADWGGNILGAGAALAPGANFQLRPSQGAGCRFDLRLVLADGREVLLRNQDICADRVIEMALQPSAAPPAAATPGTPEGQVTALPTAKPPPLPPGAGVPPPPAGGSRPNPYARVSSGTGFVVAQDRVMTNHHVVDGCSRILVRTHDGRTLEATPPARVDARRDLALLTVPGDPGPALTFRSNAARRGEGVVTYGFPLAGLLSSGPTLTTGEISALSGLGDNQQQYQISAPVQPGNSGGPLLDRHGHVVGVIVSKLNAARVAQHTGDIPQNVNFAVKGSEAVDFLRRTGVQPQMAESRGAERSAAEIGELAHRSTVFVRCER
ncbi:MAG TPA: trypsin-like peptidase domain-containing protein [Acetobacteraceae bacterium]|nr:trypsin-like peptidase domain-containing protein [Acetobacteraceae bacterium]